MLNIRSRGFDRAGIWLDVLIKFNKQIGNSFAKIINTEMNSKPS